MVYTHWLFLDRFSNRVVFLSSATRAGPFSLVLLDGSQGTQLATYPLRMQGSPTALAFDRARGRLVIGTDEERRVGGTAYNPLVQQIGRVVLVDIRTGRVLHHVVVVRTFKAGNAPVLAAVDSQRAHGFVVLLNGRILMIDLRSGAARITSSLHTLMMNSAALVAERTGRLFIAAESYVAMFDTSTGRLVKRIHREAESLALDQGTGHIVAAGFSRISILDPATGRVLAETRHLLGIGSVVVDSVHGRVYFAPFGRKTLTVLDARTARILGHIRVPTWPYRIASGPPVDIDVRTGILLVAGGVGDKLVEVDVRAGRAVRSLPVPTDDILINESTERAFVASDISVSVIDTHRSPNRASS